jgi:chorismate synthase
MSTLRYITAGESHGKALIGILEGIPSGLRLSEDDIAVDLKRRQGGYGRGGRMKIESDRAKILSGVRWGRTIGSPITLLLENRDYKNWIEGMSPNAAAEGAIPAVTRPRPGHADLPGTIKYGFQDIRDVLERSSARETAMRVALGAIAKKILSEFGITVGSCVIQIGNQHIELRSENLKEANLLRLFRKAEKSPVRCPDEKATRMMMKLIDAAIRNGNSLGGIFEVFATGIPIGLGSHIQWDKRLDGRLAQALMSIQAMKGVEVGLGFAMSRKTGSEVMDEIFYSPPLANKGQKVGDIFSKTTTGFYRKTNHAGGIEGGMTNGMPLILRAAMKPIPTLRKPLRSIDIRTRQSVLAAYERSDICAVPAAGVIGEAMVALTVTDVFLEKFGGDSMAEVKRHYRSYMNYLEKF